MLQEYKNSYTYLFEDKEFYKKIWLLPIMLFAFIKYPFGIIFIKGWQVQMVQDILNDKPLQKIDFFPTFIKGLQITFVSLAYFTVPVILSYVFGLKGIIAFLSDIYRFIQGDITGTLTQILKDYVYTFALYITWGMISNPILQSGIIRYALSSDWKALLNVPANMLFLIRHGHQFIKFYVYYLITLFILFLLDLCLTIFAFPVAILLSPIIIILYYGAVSYELGHLARKIAQRQIQSA